MRRKLCRLFWLSCCSFLFFIAKVYSTGVFLIRCLSLGIWFCLAEQDIWKSRSESLRNRTIDLLQRQNNKSYIKRMIRNPLFLSLLQGKTVGINLQAFVVRNIHVWNGYNSLTNMLGIKNCVICCIKRCITWLWIHLLLFTVFSITDMSECNGEGNNIFCKARDCMIMDRWHLRLINNVKVQNINPR